jgi:predicted dinucleotide-binding enzyme
MPAVGQTQAETREIVEATTVGFLAANSQIARLALAKNYDVVIGNSHGPETLPALVAELKPRAHAATAVNAAKLETSS